MTWKEYCEKRQPYLDKVEEIERELGVIEDAYIKEHAEFEWGTHVIIRTKKKTHHAVVVGYDIGDNGRCIPRLALIEKSRRKSFFRMHEYDESIVIEKYVE